MKLIYVLCVVAIMVVINKGSPVPDSMEDAIDVSESQPELREFDEDSEEKL